MSDSGSRALPWGMIPFITVVIPVLILALSCSTKPKEPEEVYTRRKQADSLMLQGYNRTDTLNFDLAWSAFDAALDIYASLDNREGIIDALLALGRTKRMTGENDSAEELFSHAESMASFSDNPRLTRSVLNHQADLALRQGDPVQAMDLLADRIPEVTGGRERSAQLRLKGAARYAMGAENEAAALLIEAAGIAEANTKQKNVKVINALQIGAVFSRQS